MSERKGSALTASVTWKPIRALWADAVTPRQETLATKQWSHVQEASDTLAVQRQTTNEAVGELGQHENAVITLNEQVVIPNDKINQANNDKPKGSTTDVHGYCPHCIQG